MLKTIYEQFTGAQVTRALTSLLLMALGGLVTSGVLTSTEANTVAGALAAIVVVGLEIYFKRVNGQVASTAKLPQVETIVAKPTVAAKVPSAKVVPHK